MVKMWEKREKINENCSWFDPKRWFRMSEVIEGRVGQNGDRKENEK